MNYFVKSFCLLSGRTVKNYAIKFAFLLLAALPLILEGCSGGDIPPAVSPSTGYSLYLSVSKNSILTNDTDSTQINATVMNGSLGQAGVKVTFATTGGRLDTTSATTDTNGKASVNLTSGPLADNQTITVTAQIAGATTSVPVQISGNTLDLSIPTTNVKTGASQILTSTLQNAVPQGIANASISYAIISGADVVSLSNQSGITNFAGQSQITVTGLKAGSAVIQASSKGTISEITLTVQGADGFSIYLSVSKTSILANDSDSSTITATVLINNVKQSGVEVSFRADGGLLDSASVITGDDGKASVSISSGPASSNKTVTITAEIDGATTSIPIQIIGNSLALSVPQSNMAIDSSQLLTATLQNAVPIGIANATVTFSIVSGADVVSLSSTNGSTNTTGQTQVDVTALKAGTAIIQASSMGVTSQISLSVAAYSLSMSVNKTSVLANDSDSAVITATVLNGSIGQAGVNVTFSTTGGRLAASSAITGADGKASVNITSGVRAENKSINITAEISGATASVPLQISGNELLLSLPASNMVLGSDQILTVSLLDGDSLGIADATVTFTVESGGEVISLSKSAETTDAIGQAHITLTAMNNGSAVIAASSMGVTAKINVVVGSEGGYTIFLSASKNSILTDDTDSAIITATAIKDSAVQVGVNISFSSNGGLLSATSGTTGADGKASVTITSGPRIDNQVIEIKAESAGAIPYTVPLQITGNTLALSIPQTNIAVGKSEKLLATLQNALPLGMANKDITFTVESGAETVSLSSLIGTTDFAGQTNVNVTGVQGGTATIAAVGGGVTSRIKLTITTESFEITAPDEPVDLLTSDAVGLEVTVRAPAPATSVVFQSTIGGWNSVPGQSMLEVPVVAGFANARLTSPDNAGLATITVYDKNTPTTRDSMQVSIYAPDTEADNVDLQPTQANVAVTPAGSTSQNSVTLTATVKNNRNFPVGKAVVHFTLVDVTGGGEYLSTGMAITDSTGVATCTFYSGTLGSSGNGVKIVATVAETGKNDTAFITITDKAGSVTLNKANFILVDSGDQTKYIQKITAYVANANGNPVANALISLNLWPTAYSLGYWGTDPLSGETREVYTPWPCSGLIAQPNEDVNRNLILDPGEDTGPMGTPDGFLTPANSAAGLVPATVTTDDTGWVTFEITYPKGSAPWLEVELTATVTAQGSESQAKLNWVLDYLASDVTGTLRPNDGSPYGYFIGSCPGETPTPDSLKLSTPKTSILADDSDSTVITATVLKSNVGQAGVIVNFTTTAGQLSAASATTGADGKASVAITSGAGANNQTFRVTATTAGLTSSIPLRITGNTLELSIPQSTVTVGTVQPLTSTLQNPIPQGIADATITYTVVSGTDIVSLSSETMMTDFDGTANIYVTALKAGTAIIEATSMGVTAQIVITVETSTVYSLKLATSKNSILANDSDSAVITATVLKNNVGQAGIIVTFAADGGQISSTTATTGADGKASITITSGAGADNQTINISAAIDGATDAVPLEITGNTLALSLASATMALGSNQPLSAILQNAVPLGIGNATIHYTIISGADVVSLSSTTSTTNATGRSSITVSALKVGTALIEASSKGVTSQISVSVQSFSFYVATSKTSILSNNSDSAVITATVLSGNVGQPGVLVTFSTTVGQFDTTTAITGIDGKASVNLTSGPGASNQSILVTASISGATATVPLLITGNTLTLTLPQTNLVTGSSSTLTATLQNGMPLGIANANITFSVVSGTDVISLSSSSEITDASGQAHLTVNALKNGAALIVAQSMGLTAQINVIVATEGGYTIYLSSSKTSILANDTDSAIITATAIKDSIIQPGVTITFSSNGGSLSSASGITDANGKASITIISGPKSSNQVISITATNNNATDTIPLSITGNTLTLSVPQTNMAIPTVQTLSATLMNALPIGVANSTVKFVVESGNSVTLSSPTGTLDTDGRTWRVATNHSGQADISVTAVDAGSSTILAEGLGVQTRIKIEVSTLAFEIIAPSEPANLTTSDLVGLAVKVRAPAPATTVIFHSTVGIWNSQANQIEVPVVAEEATAYLTSTQAAGLATVTVYNKDDTATRDSIHVSIYAPDTEADNVIVQASQEILAVTPVNAASKNSVTITATVRNSKDFPVGEAVVYFTLSDTTGGGEYLSTGMAITDSSGEATCTFYSGTLGSSNNGVRITATVAKTGKSNSTNVRITDLAGSIVLGKANKIIVDSTDYTKYIQRITAQVSDANGNPVANAAISLSLWPTTYFLGYWGTNPLTQEREAIYNEWPLCSGIINQLNEDANRNLILDPFEDLGPLGTPDGFLTPLNSAAGSVPATVTTDETGMVTFDITYLKRYAAWLAVELTATVKVQGSETQAKMNWGLDYLAEDLTAVFAPNDGSPFGAYVANCPGNIHISVLDTVDSTPIVGADVSVNGTNCITGSEGTCTIYDVPAGTQTLTVQASGYIEGTSTVSVPSGGTVTTEIGLAKITGTINFTVQDSNPGNQQVVGALVSLSTGGSCTTSIFGTCTITDIPLGEQDLLVSAEGYITSPITPLIVNAGTEYQTIYITPQPPAAP